MLITYWNVFDLCQIIKIRFGRFLFGGGALSSSYASGSRHASLSEAVLHSWVKKTAYVSALRYSLSITCGSVKWQLKAPHPEGCGRPAVPPSPWGVLLCYNGVTSSHAYRLPDPLGYRLSACHWGRGSRGLLPMPGRGGPGQSWERCRWVRILNARSKRSGSWLSRDGGIFWNLKDY